MKKLSTGIEVSASGESRNSGDPAVHPAAHHRAYVLSCVSLTKYLIFSVIVVKRISSTLQTDKIPVTGFETVTYL